MVESIRIKVFPLNDDLIKVFPVSSGKDLTVILPSNILLFSTANCFAKKLRDISLSILRDIYQVLKVNRKI